MRRLQGDAIDEGLADLAGWACVEEHHLEKRYAFGDFAAALAFVDRVGEAAEAQDHHPDITFGWGYAEVRMHTHRAGGITARDFALAAACDAAYEASPSAGVQGKGCGS